MDKKIKRYQDIIVELLHEHAQSYNQSNLEIKAQAICDYENNHFQLLNVGWQKGKYYFYPVFHFDIRDGKVWLQENRTDILIAQELVDRGIPKEDIVLGLHPPEARPLTGYAVA